jgi:Gram-negative bacterial TonB protein C-terminal
MINHMPVRAGVLLLLSLLPSAAQQSAIVNLKIIHNGRPRPVPDHINLSFDDHSLEIPVQKGKFEVPPEFVAAPRVTFETDVEGSHIRLSDIAGADFTDEDWTVRLAERANDDYYAWRGPKTARIPSTCMLYLESIHEEPGRVYFEEHCRSKKESAGKSGTEQQVKPAAPKVVRASVPFYPSLARQTGIQGAVTLRVSTDGQRVSAVDAGNGPPLLVNAAKENVKTWQFEPHPPRSFEVKFRYRLLDSKCDSECKCGSEEKPSVVLQLPANVEVSAESLMLCDPAVEIRHKN